MTPLTPTLITAQKTRPNRTMTLLLLEALGALVLLVFIVWWTMFSGRKGGELPEGLEEQKRDQPQDQDKTEDR